VLSFLASGLSACTEDPKANLPGTWKVVPDPAAAKPTGTGGVVSDIQSSWVIELKQDGTFRLTMTVLGAPKAIEGTWSVSGQSLTLTPGKVDPSLQAATSAGQVIVLTVDPGGARLTLQGRSGKQMTFQKQS
jgi:hypothetical protein